MSDLKSYGEVACEASLGDVWDSLPDAVKSRWEDAAQAVIKEFKARSRDTQPMHYTTDDGVIHTGRTVVGTHDGFKQGEDGYWERTSTEEDGKS